jgi:hypothetical protein
VCTHAVRQRTSRTGIAYCRVHGDCFGLMLKPGQVCRDKERVVFRQPALTGLPDRMQTASAVFVLMTRSIFLANSTGKSSSFRPDCPAHAVDCWADVVLRLAPCLIAAPSLQDHNTYRGHRGHLSPGQSPCLFNAPAIHIGRPPPPCCGDLSPSRETLRRSTVTSRNHLLRSVIG